MKTKTKKPKERKITVKANLEETPTPLIPPLTTVALSAAPTDYAKRLRALELAAGSCNNGAVAADIVGKAKSFYEFLTNTEEEFVLGSERPTEDKAEEETGDNE